MEKIIPVDFSGVIQCDGYTGYDAFARRHPGGVELIGCWAHVRRKFFDALEQAPRQAALVLHLIQNLYRTEARLRQTRASPKLRSIALNIEAQPVIARLRPTAVGKKNWLFVGEAEAGDRSAIIYTIIESCRRRGIDPYAYLRDMFTRLPAATNWQIKELTPEAWAKAHRSAQLLRAA